VPFATVDSTVPVILPAALKVNPAGSSGVVLLHVKGAIPPFSVSLSEYGVPFVAVPSVSFAILIAPSLSGARRWLR